MSLSQYLPKVLISHSWYDKHEAMLIVDGLRNLECAHVWIDFEHMQAGVDIDQEIRSQIQQADFLILVWTEKALASPNVLNEILWSKELEKTIIPCVFHFESDGEASRELSDKLRTLLGSNILWVEFRKTDQAIIELYSAINNVFMKRLPQEIAEVFHEKNQAIKRMEGYNKYLVNYRNVKHKEADRESSVNRLMNEVEKLIDLGADQRLIKEFMIQIQQLEFSDPEAYQVIKPRLKQYMARNEKYQYQLPASVQVAFQNPDLENLRRIFLEMVKEEGDKATSFNFLMKKFPDASDQLVRDSIQGIINVTGDGINLLNQAFNFSSQAGLTKEFDPILHYVTDYFYHVDDIRSDDLGPWGWVDDSYLCFSSLQQINQVYFTMYQHWLFQVDFNPYLQYLVQSLEHEELLQLDHLLQSKFKTIDWSSLLIKFAGISISSMLFGNQLVNDNHSWGGSWEDEMNQRAARLGISLNF